MRGRLDLPPSVIAALDLLEEDDIGILIAQKRDRPGKTDICFVRAFFIPDLPVLHVKGQRAEHRFCSALPARAEELRHFPAAQQGNYHAQTPVDSSRPKRPNHKKRLAECLPKPGLFRLSGRFGLVSSDAGCCGQTSLQSMTLRHKRSFLSFPRRCQSRRSSPPRFLRRHSRPAQYLEEPRLRGGR